MTTQFIVKFNEAIFPEVSMVGGKATSLIRLTQAGLPIPPGFVITTEAYSEYRDGNTNPELEVDILKAFDELGAERVAVRSSAIAEDAVDASWAGQFESYLNVTREQLIESIKKCWQSASTEVVQAYAESKAVARDKLAIAVVVQKMVNSEVAGVAFSINPITNNRDEIMIEAVYGLGELLVQGMITPDNYLVDKSSLEVINKDIPRKTVKMVYYQGENVEQPVPESQQAESCLEDREVSELAELVSRIEQYYGNPQDIEWAVEAGNFYIVQSRPVTTI